MHVASILQSGYLPYCGFFELVSRCDTFVILDDVQFDKHSWRNRNRIRGFEGPLWLTVPIYHKGRMGQKINEVEINNGVNWGKKHFASLRQNYGRAKYYERYVGWLEEYYSKPWSMLSELNRAFIDFALNDLGIRTTIVNSSSLGAVGTKTERLVSVCNEIGADAYISTNGSKPYIDIGMFKDNGIAFTFQDYQPPEYPQVFKGFFSYLSVIDMLFNLGPEAMTTILSTSSCPFHSL